MYTCEPMWSSLFVVSLLLGYLCTARARVKLKACVCCNRQDWVQDGIQTRIDKHTHKNTVRGCHKDKYLEMPLLLHHGCRNVPSLEDGVILTKQQQTAQQNKRKLELNHVFFFIVATARFKFLAWHTLVHTAEARVMSVTQGKPLKLYRGCVKL